MQESLRRIVRFSLIVYKKKTVLTDKAAITQRLRKQKKEISLDL